MPPPPCSAKHQNYALLVGKQGFTGQFFWGDFIYLFSFFKKLSFGFDGLTRGGVLRKRPKGAEEPVGNLLKAEGDRRGSIGNSAVG